jgi:hypothetical protein
MCVPTRAPYVAAVLGAAVLVTACGAAGSAPPAAPPSSAPSSVAAPTTPATASTASTASTAPASAAPDPNGQDVSTIGDIPDNQVFVPFPAADGSFSVSVPQGWARSADGTATVFTDKFNRVRIEAGSRPSAPDVTTVRDQDVAALQSSVPGFDLVDVQQVQRRAGEAILVTYRGSSAPNPVTGRSVTEAVERYSFWSSGQQVVLTLAGPQGADNVDPWRTITDSFRWTR